MRLALLQLGLDSKSRAMNMQALILGIQRAAQSTPPPDLLVLPGVCDTGGMIACHGHTDACLDGVKETIASQAREWGVFIAAGLHIHSAVQGRTHGAFLFDPDGDVVAVCRPQDSPESAGGTATWDSSVGRLGLADPSRLYEGNEQFGPGTLLAVPVATGKNARKTVTTKLEAARKAGAGGIGIYWAVVSCADKSHSAGKQDEAYFSFVSDGLGVLLARAEGAWETIVYADVPCARLGKVSGE